jgi:hypothetical protein
MPDIEDITLDRARRIAYLFQLGVHSDVINAAICRSPDGETLGVLLGFIEDILDLGCTVSDPQ